MPTSPAPDAAAPPGMCPGVAVMGGGGGGGDGDGDGGGGKDGSGGGGKGDGKGGAGGGKGAQGAPDYAKYPECGYASHPVDVVTGRAFTHPITDLELPGPLPLRFQRMYSSKMAERDVGLGYGWGHTFGWEIEVGRRQIRVWNEQGIAVDFPMIAAGTEVIGPWGWLLRRDEAGFALDVDDGVWRRFATADEPGKRYRLTAVEDLNRNRIVLTYKDGRLVELQDSAGRLIRNVPTKEGRIGSLQVKNAIAQGNWVAFAEYTYDEHGNLVQARDADGFSAHYAYDEEHRLTEDTDRTGLTFHFLYDREGRCIESWGDYPGERDPSLIEDLPTFLSDHHTRVKGIHHCRFDYGPNGYSEVADSSQVRRYFGNEHGTLDKRVEGGAMITATYRADGHILSRTDAMDATTTFERDERGRLLKVTDPQGRVTVAERDANGLPVKITDAVGGVTMIERDLRGNALLLADPAGGIITRHCDERGLATERVSGTGARTAYAYDAHGNLVSIKQPNGGIWRFTYDSLGRLLSRTDPSGAETRYAYSLRGDLTAVRNADGNVTRYAYDGEGHLTQVVDPKGRITALTWGGYHKLCVRKDANGNEVRLRYNLEGELVEVHNERGEIQRLTYSGSGLLTGETTFDGRELGYRHDAAGRVTQITNGLRQTTDLEYDRVGQLVKREFDDGDTEEFSYNERGDLIRAKGAGGELRFERDALGRIVREAQIVSGKEHWIEITYDAAGQRVGRTTSLGHSEVVTRGALGERAQTVLNGMQVVDHRADTLGREIARSLQDGGWIQSGYDAFGRVNRRRAGEARGRRAAAAEPEWIGVLADGATVDTAYQYDSDGELVASSDQARGQTRYEYDPIGQLLSMVPEKARAKVFWYDAAGNLYEGGAQAQEREYGKGNRLLRKGNTEYRWDSDGRLIEARTRERASLQDEVWRYQWDAAGLMRAAEGPDGTRVEFAYDPLARRVQKRVSKTNPTSFEREPVSVTRFVWDGDVLVHEIREEARTSGDPIVHERTYWFQDNGFEPLAHQEKHHDVGPAQGAWFHYVNNPVGTPERLIAENGSVACELEREAWGEAQVVGPARATTPLRLQGQYADEETGLTYNRWRYLFAGGDLFCSPDPLGLMAGTHPYRSVWNPISWVDPFGLASMSEAEALLNASQGRPFPGGSNVGHADWHVPPPGANSAAAHAASRGNANNTTFRNRNQAIRALRNCMTQNEQALNNLQPGQTLGGTYRPPQTLDGQHSANGQAATPVNVNSVTYRFGKLPNGDLHLLHFQPHGS